MKQAKTKSRILLIVPFTYPYHAGGGLSALNFGKWLIAEGYKTQIITFNRNHRYNSEETIDGLTIHRLNYFNRNTFLKFLSLFILIPNYISHIHRHDCIILYGSYIVGWEFIVFIGRLLGCRVIYRSTMIGEDDIESLLNYRKILHPLRSLAIQNISGYFSITPKFSEVYEQIIGNSTKIMETSQGVSTQRFKPVNQKLKSRIRKKLDLPHDTFIIISIGTVLRRKGYLKIFHELNKQNVPFLFLVLGDYQLDEDHHFFVQHKEVEKVYLKGKEILGEKVQFRGFVDNAEEYLQASDLFLMGSFKEGLPNALLEAMASGLPAVARNINLIEGFLLHDGGNCILFDEYSELPGLINKLISDPELCRRLGANARAKIMESHTFEHTCTQLRLK